MTNAADIADGIIASVEDEKTHIAESQHWYKEDGTPCYTIKGAKGQDRAPTLRDARKLNLYIGTTEIIKQAARPGLTAWWEGKLIEAAYCVVAVNNSALYSKKEWIAKAYEAARQDAKKAREYGESVHASLQAAFNKQSFTDHLADVQSVKALLDFHLPRTSWTAEVPFASSFGYGGKIDLYGERLDERMEPQSVIIDFKTTEFDPPGTPGGKNPVAYDEHAMQGIAYGKGINPALRDNLIVANIFISSTNPGLVKMHIWNAADLNRAWLMFSSLLAFWQASKGYRPT